LFHRIPNRTQFLIQPFVTRSRSHSVVLYVGMTCFIEVYIESGNMKVGMCSQHISLVTGCLVVRGSEGIFTRRLSSSQFNVELFQIRPSTIESGHPMQRSINCP